jgi:glycosyltransferase involved in cell wall biosynthesis
MAILEAMAAGLPLIVTPVGGIPDVVTDRREGLFVKPGDTTGLTRAMATLIADESRRLALGRQARIRSEQFNAGSYAEALLQLYRQIVEERAKACAPSPQPSGRRIMSME